MIPPRLRRTARSILAAVCLVTAGAVLAACSPVKEDRGYIFDPKDLTKIQAGVTSKEQVRTIMGSPSTTSTIDGEAWYYISSKFETYTFNRPQEIDRAIAAFYFEKTDVVQEVAYYGLEDGQIVNFVDRTTPTRGKELTVLGQLFGNLGRYNAPGAGIPTTGAGNPNRR
ncbi:MAG: outer membrane protein assembly factor BamE [Alphaproteobacteria bacterium HGW-Alphaproteobacteria-11]|nr:MAG: outer membrane protein assembly factor BamE [Alphaproteobacteria bacterium HGW-Alphaproteobacteria-11]